MIMTLIKLYNEHVMEELNKPKGSITWIRCEYQLPIIAKYGTLIDLSDCVLILLEKKEIIKTKAVFEKDGTFIGWENNGTPYAPTHWAYINYPE